MIQLVEMEMVDLLNHYGFEGEETPIVSGSALAALEGKSPEIGEQAILKLMQAVDSFIPTPDVCVFQCCFVFISYVVVLMASVLWTSLSYTPLKMFTRLLVVVLLLLVASNGVPSPKAKKLLWLASVARSKPLSRVHFLGYASHFHYLLIYLICFTL